MNASVSTEILIRTPALLQTFIPLDVEKNGEWSAISLAVQRGRDHGISGYSKYLNLCEARLSNEKDKQTTFDDLEFAGITEEARQVLEKLYL